MTLACQTLWFFQTCLSAFLSDFTWCLARNRKNKREFYTHTVLSRFSESSSASCVLADVFHLLPSLHLSHEPRVRGISGWIPSLCFSTSQKLAIVKSYLWYHTQKSLLNVHRKHIHNGSCNASFLPENTVQFVQSTWSHLCIKQYSITQMLTNEKRWQQTKRKKKSFSFSLILFSGYCFDVTKTIPCMEWTPIKCAKVSIFRFLHLNNKQPIW